MDWFERMKKQEEEDKNNLIKSVQQFKIPQNPLLPSYTFDAIKQNIENFEEKLDLNHIVGVNMTTVTGPVTILINSIKLYSGSSLIVFTGINSNDGSEVELMQHISQISILLTAYPKDSNIVKKKIGFFIEKNEE